MKLGRITCLALEQSPKEVSRARARDISCRCCSTPCCVNSTGKQQFRAIPKIDGQPKGLTAFLKGDCSLFSLRGSRVPRDRALQLESRFATFLLGIALILAWPVLIQAEDFDQATSSKIARTRVIMEGGESAAKQLAALPADSAEDRSSLGSVALRLIQGLGLCAGVFFVGIHFARKYNRPKNLPGGRGMRVVERIQLAPKTSLVLVEAEGRRILVSVGSERVTFMDGALDSVIERESVAEFSEEDNESMELTCLKRPSAA